jgi:MFS family permease
LVRLIVAQALDDCGGSCVNVGLAWWVAKQGSASDLATVLTAAVVARVVATPLGGTLGDAADRRRVLVRSLVLHAAVSLLWAYVAHAQAYGLGRAVCLAATVSALQALFDTSLFAALPRVAGERPETAFQLQQTASAAGSILGGLAGGWLTTAWGPSAAFLAHALLLVAASIVSATVRTPLQGRARVRAASMRRFIAAQTREIATGFRVLRQLPLLLGLASVALVLNFASAPLNALIPALIIERGQPPWVIGALESSAGAGTFLGAAIAGRFARSARPDLAVITLTALVGAGFVAIVGVDASWIPLAAMGVASTGATALNVMLSHRRTRATPDHLQARLNAATVALAGLAAPLGTWCGGRVAGLAGTGPTIAACGLLVVAMAPLLRRVPDFRAFMTCDARTLPRFLLDRHPTAFAPDSEELSAGAPSSPDSASPSLSSVL